ncbi:MAG: DUF805 domain-containing protein [bacterium]|nr:DUF805 domain-containing protein [bacterium]
MGFIEATKTCLTKYADFNGRASRSEFWFFTLFYCIYYFSGAFLLGFAVGYNNLSEETIGIGLFVLFIPILLPSIAACARRLHDINQSGWIQCIFIPGFLADTFLGTGYVLYLITLALWIFWFAQAGKKGKNKFGAQPRK